MMDPWYIIGPGAVAVVGWFVGMEIKRLRSMIDQLLKNQHDMAVHIAQLQAEIRTLKK